MRHRRLVSVVAVVALAGTALFVGLAADKPEDQAVARARKTVKMLDDVYKTAVVLITQTYVNKQEDTSAGTAAKALFGEIKKKGWHEARLIDATGMPYLEENVANDDFEKAALKALKGGKDYYETVVEDKGQRYLRAATPVPVVLEKCVMCHDHYKDAKKGEPIGAIVYKIKVE